MNIHEQATPEDNFGDEVRLGDAHGDDARLREALEKIAEIAHADRPGTGGFRLHEFLAGCVSSTARGGWKIVTSAVSGGAELFASLVPKIIEKRSEAREREELVEPHMEVLLAEANKINAEAAKMNADADLTTAVAEEMRSNTKRKDALLREIKKRGIDFIAGDPDEILRICVTKEEPEKDVDSTTKGQSQQTPAH